MPSLTYSAVLTVIAPVEEVPIFMSPVPDFKKKSTWSTPTLSVTTTARDMLPASLVPSGILNSVISGESVSASGETRSESVAAAPSVSSSLTQVT